MFYSSHVNACQAGPKVKNHYQKNAGRDTRVLSLASDCVLARQDFRESRIIRKKIYDRTYAWILIWENTSVEPQDPKIQA